MKIAMTHDYPVILAYPVQKYDQNQVTIVVLPVR
jgi:hypothetical protein